MVGRRVDQLGMICRTLHRPSCAHSVSGSCRMENNNDHQQSIFAGDKHWNWTMSELRNVGLDVSQFTVAAQV